jgi:rhodanese-related sulfurtransferase
MRHLGLPAPDQIQQALQVNQSGFELGEVSFPLVSEIAGVPEIEARELERALGLADRPVLLDVREPEEFVGDLGHIAGALLVPLDTLQLRLPKLAGFVDRPIVAICRAGARSASAVAMLKRAGFSRVVNLRGGMLAWSAAALPVQR